MTKTVAVRGSVVRAPVVPPGGFAGNAQQTGVTQLIFAKATGRAGGLRSARRRKRRKAKAAAPKRRRTRTRGPLKKGSAAAKRRMAQLRSMRRRRR